MGNKINKPKISIIIITWNTSQITQKCVQTINKYLNNIEIIVVDNGSADDTITALSKIKNVKLIKNKSNLGFSKANNIGLKHATSEYVLFMNSDIELIDDSLNEMHEYLSQHSKIGIIGPQFLNPDLTPQASVFPKQSAFNAFKEFWLNIPNSYSKYIPNKNTPTSVWAISGGCIIAKKDFFTKIGGWNEKYFFYFEDMDLCRAIHKENKEVTFYPQCKIIHRHGASGSHLASSENQWKRLIPGSKLYHGNINHYLINSIIWSGQKWQKIKKIIGLK